MRFKTISNMVVSPEVDERLSDRPNNTVIRLLELLLHKTDIEQKYGRGTSFYNYEEENYNPKNSQRISQDATNKSKWLST